ncbi:hypothetical protein E4U21_001490 [Claviceps maximensis]|nr:hypothetical protein E4U21_001490 [Claviceps maximensis]
MTRRRTRRRTRGRIQMLSLLFLFSLALAHPNFVSYPPKAQSCFSSALSIWPCPYIELEHHWICVCGDSILGAAQCLGQKDEEDVQPVYSTLNQACSEIGMHMTVAAQDFFDAATGSTAFPIPFVTLSPVPTSIDAAGPTETTTPTEATASKGSATPSESATPTGPATSTGPAASTEPAASTRTATSIGAAMTTKAATTTEAATKIDSSTATRGTDKPAEPAASESSGSAGLSKEAVIGIALGAAATGVMGTAVLAMLCRRRRRRQHGMESHPMLDPGDNYFHNMPVAVQPSERSCKEYRKSAAGPSPLPLPSLRWPQKSPASQTGAHHGVSHPEFAPRNAVLWSTRQPPQTRDGLEKICELDGSSASVPWPLPLPRPRPSPSLGCSAAGAEREKDCPPD